MRTAIVATGLLIASTVVAQSPQKASISVSYEVDGRPATCTEFGIELRLNGEIIKPRQTSHAFEVPDAFRRQADKWNDAQRTDISLTCNEHTFAFPSQYPAFVRQGHWRLGVAQPLYAVREYGYTHEFDRGAWLAYLIFPGEPEVITFASQPDPPAGMRDALEKEQPNASGKRAQDIAYVLAVFNVEYQRNRDYLLSLLNGCLARPKESPEDDECDRDVLKLVTNLYWRGDKSLLIPLLTVADIRNDVIGDIGTFYAELLDRRGAESLDGIGKLPAEKQQLVCQLAYDADLSLNSPKRDRVLVFLRGRGTDSANRCSSVLKNSER